MELFLVQDKISKFVFILLIFIKLSTFFSPMNTHRGCKNNEIFGFLANLDSCLWRIQRSLHHPPQLPHLLLEKTQPFRALLPDLVALVGREQDRQSHLLGDVGGIETLYLEVEELVNSKDERTFHGLETETVGGWLRSGDYAVTV